MTEILMLRLIHGVGGIFWVGSGLIGAFFLTPDGERLVADALPLWTQVHARVVAILGSEAAAELRDRFDAAVAAAVDPPL